MLEPFLRVPGFDISRQRSGSRGSSAAAPRPGPARPRRRRLKVTAPGWAPGSEPGHQLRGPGVRAAGGCSSREIRAGAGASDPGSLPAQPSPEPPPPPPPPPPLSRTPAALAASAAAASPSRARSRCRAGPARARPGVRPRACERARPRGARRAGRGGAGRAAALPAQPRARVVSLPWPGFLLPPGAGGFPGTPEAVTRFRERRAPRKPAPGGQYRGRGCTEPRPLATSTRGAPGRAGRRAPRWVAGPWVFATFSEGTDRQMRTRRFRGPRGFSRPLAQGS